MNTSPLRSLDASVIGAELSATRDVVQIFALFRIDVYNARRVVSK
jgi:hypothetical protein